MAAQLPPPPAAAAQRLTAQLLAGEPAATADGVVGRLLAVQGQDPRGARLAIRARSARLTAADVDRALTDDRALVITWLNRGTLHLVRAEDYWWLHPLTAPRQRAGIARRLAQEQVPPADADRAVSAIEAALAAEGALTRGQLRDRIAAAGVRTQGQALVHELALASLRGLIVRGPVIGGEHAYVLIRDWLGRPPRAVDRDVALAELARRYLAGHGPASEQDLAKWAGLPAGDARRGLTAIAAGLADRDDGLAALASPAAPLTLTGRGPVSAALAGPAGREPVAARPASPAALAAPVPPPRLLGAFDPLLHGWVSRQPVLGAHQGIITVNGLFRPFALVSGRAAATWSLAGGEVALSPLAPIGPADQAALRADAADVVRFLGGMTYRI